MTNRSAVISHGLSFLFSSRRPLLLLILLLVEAEEKEEYTRVPVAGGTDSGDCECACVFVCMYFKRSKPRLSQQVMEAGRGENQCPENMERELMKWL